MPRDPRRESLLEGSPRNGKQTAPPRLGSLSRLLYLSYKLMYPQFWLAFLAWHSPSLQVAMAYPLAIKQRKFRPRLYNTAKPIFASGCRARRGLPLVTLWTRRGVWPISGGASRAARNAFALVNAPETAENYFLDPAQYTIFIICFNLHYLIDSDVIICRTFMENFVRHRPADIHTPT